MKTEKLKEKLSLIKEKAIGAGKKIGAKNMIIICAVLICGIAISLNFIIGGNDASNSDQNASGYKIDPSYYAGILESGDASPANAEDTSSGSDYFVTAVYNRDRARDEAMEVLATVASSENAIDEVKNKAEEDIAVIASAIEAEANIEELVKARGFEECVAVINGDLASVIVKSDGLLPSEIAQITEIVYEQAGILPVNLNIIEK